MTMSVSTAPAIKCKDFAISTNAASVSFSARDDVSNESNLSNDAKTVSKRKDLVFSLFLVCVFLMILVGKELRP